MVKSSAAAHAEKASWRRWLLGWAEWKGVCQKMRKLRTGAVASTMSMPGSFEQKTKGNLEKLESCSEAIYQVEKLGHFERGEP